MYAVIGKEEVEQKTLALTSRKKGDLGKVSLSEAVRILSTAAETYVEPHEVGGWAQTVDTVAESSPSEPAAAAPSSGRQAQLDALFERLRASDGQVVEAFIDSSDSLVDSLEKVRH